MDWKSLGGSQEMAVMVTVRTKFYWWFEGVWCWFLEGGYTNSPELSLLKFDNHHSHFLAASLDFTTYSHCPPFWSGSYLFYN